MAYSNAVFYLDYEGGSDTARTALTSVAVANNGSGLVRCTKTSHGLVTGAVIDATLNYAGAWMVTRIDANNFDLVGSTYSTATAMTVTPRGGSSKADAWKNFAAGATLAHIAAGDTIRVMGSPQPTLVGNATWNNNSKTITLASAVTTTISTCETAWTASANVTCSVDTAAFKEGSKSAKTDIATAFTTGLVAYFPTGTLDLSGYQQVSFWLKANTPTTALSLRLCSDTAGATTVNTLAMPGISPSEWTAITVDNAAALGSAIQSVAIYADVDPGVMSLNLDNIIACKASSAADSITLRSLLGKVWNLSWVASTTYAANDIRKPTQPNRNGYRYKVTAGGGGSSGSTEPTWPQEIGATVADGALTWTCEGLEDTWLAPQSISGTTILLDNHANCLGNVGKGYDGATETVAMYKRETIFTTFIASGANWQSVPNYSATAAGPVTISGGWDRTSMTVQDGETWVQEGGGNGYFFHFNSGGPYIISNLNGVRGLTGMRYPGPLSTVRNCHFNQFDNQGFWTNSAPVAYQGLCSKNCNTQNFIDQATPMMLLNMRAATFSGAISHGVNLQSTNGSTGACVDIVTKNNGGYGIVCSAYKGDFKLTGWISAGNGNAGLLILGGPPVLINCSVADTTQFGAPTAYSNTYIYSHNHQQTAGNHLITADGGTIVSATDQRHTASGISWKFRPTSTTRGSSYPLRLSIAKIACTASTAVSVQIWTRRDTTTIFGTLKIAGGQIAGVGADVTVACAPTTNTWVQSSTLTFTPTANGVVELTFECYDGVGVVSNMWIDDLTVT